MADKQSREVYDKLEKDLQFYLKHERSLVDEVKLRRLIEIKERIRGVSYVLGMEDKKINDIRETVQSKISAVHSRIEGLEKLSGESITIGKTTANLPLDVSEALKGLKALQRESRKATSALKEFEQAHDKVKRVAYECGVNGEELVSLLVSREVISNE